VPHDVRDQVVDFVRRWSEKTEIRVGRFPAWLGVTASKFYHWRQRYGRVNEHNGWIPRDFWLEAWEKEAIIAFQSGNLYCMNPWHLLVISVGENVNILESR
jgi:putative transposase